MRAAHADCLCALLLLGACPILCWEMRDVPWEGQVFPLAVIALLGACAVALGIRGLRRLRSGLGEPFRFFGEVSPKKWLVIVLAFCAYVLFAMNASFLCGTFAFAAALPLFLEWPPRGRAWLVAVLYSAGLTLFFYIFFIRIMHFNFPAF